MAKRKISARTNSRMRTVPAEWEPVIELASSRSPTVFWRVDKRIGSAGNKPADLRCTCPDYIMRKRPLEATATTPARVGGSCKHMDHVLAHPELVTVPFVARSGLVARSGDIAIADQLAYEFDHIYGQGVRRRIGTADHWARFTRYVVKNFAGGRERPTPAPENVGKLGVRRIILED